MKIDEYGVLVSEIYVEGNDYFYAGNRADSMSTTSRWVDLSYILGIYSKNILTKFITQTGYQSHPSPRMPDNLKETSISSDSALPFYLSAGTSLREQMEQRLIKSVWRTGNGNLVEPTFTAVITNSVFLMNICVLFQSLIFKFPWRWDDGQKKFVSSSTSSCDYLNWMHVALRCPKFVRKSVGKELLKSKIHEYYKPEPNVKWFLDLYDQVIERYW